MVHVYLAEQWNGEPQESEEMYPKWFAKNDMPYTAMWSDDAFWLPEVVKGNRVRVMFTFGEEDVILDKAVDIVDGF